MQIGFIGTGNMGTVLIESFITGKVMKEHEMMIANRTPEKAKKLIDRYPGITFVHDLEKLVSACKLVFFCVKQKDLFIILENLKPYLKKDHCLIYLASTVSTEQLEKWHPASWIRLIPSITNQALHGAFLLTFGENCHPDWRKTIWNWLETIGKPIEIDDERVRIASDIASCGPAFFSFILQKFITSAVHKTTIDKQLASELAKQMFIGTAKLLETQNYTLEDLQKKVLVQGGITGEGIKVLEEGKLTELFTAVFTATAEKYGKDAQAAKEFFHKNGG